MAGMPEPAATLRACALTVLRSLGPEDMPEVPGDVPDPGLWYRRRCLPVCQLAQEVAERRYGLRVPIVFGMFQDPTDPEPLRHAWFEFPDGTILDPTSAQMGLEECAVLPPSDPRQSYYHSRGSWQEGDE
jgi:hypothetical protein